MRTFAATLLLLLPGCWAEETDMRTFDMQPNQSVRFERETTQPLWVTFEAPKDFSFDAFSQTCPVLKDGVSEQAMCAEIAQIGPDGSEVALIRGVIGGGLKFTPMDGTISLRFTNFSSRPVAYQITIGADR